MLIRPCRKADAASIAHVYVQTWKDTYLGLVPFRYLYAMSAGELEQDFLTEAASKRAFSFVAEDAGEMIDTIAYGWIDTNLITL